MDIELTAIVYRRPRKPRSFVAWKEILITAAVVMAAIAWAAMP